MEFLPYTIKWLEVILRWGHVLFAILWVGNSFLFNYLDNNLNKNILKYSNPAARFSQSRFILGNKKNAQFSQIAPLERLIGRPNNYDEFGNPIAGTMSKRSEVKSALRDVQQANMAMQKTKNTRGARPDKDKQQQAIANEVSDIVNSKGGMTDMVADLAITNQSAAMGPIGALSLLAGAVSGKAGLAATLLGGAEAVKFVVNSQAKADARKIINLLQLEGKARVLTPKEKNIINNASRVLGAKVGQALTLKTTPDAYKK